MLVSPGLIPHSLFTSVLLGPSALLVPVGEYDARIDTQVAIGATERTGCGTTGVGWAICCGIGYSYARAGNYLGKLGSNIVGSNIKLRRNINYKQTKKYKDRVFFPHYNSAKQSANQKAFKNMKINQYKEQINKK